MYLHIYKRFFDIILSLCALIVLSPILLAIAVLIRSRLGSPVIFHQERPGKDEKIFRLCKFRSMTNAQDENGNLLPDSERLTEFGRKLRATSLDELPELWNILKGDMSIVGPRPQLVRDMVFMSPEQRRRHSVRPGLTGWAQVNGRNILRWEDRIKYDLEYIERISLWEDIKIIFLTVKCLFVHDDVVTDGMATSEDLGDYLLRVGEVSQEEYTYRQEEAKRELAAWR